MPNPENLNKPWKPGQSGNPNGRPKSKPMQAALKELLEKNGSEAIKAIAAVAIAKALEGDHRWGKEIFDRIDGKTIEAVDVMSDGHRINNMPGFTDEQNKAISDLKGGPGEE